jgi:hypothetical protein
MVVYKTMLRVVYQSWCERGTAETTYEVMKNSWFDMNKFNQWYKQAWIYKAHTGTVPTYTTKKIRLDVLFLE